MSAFCMLEVADGIATLTLANPSKRNALSLPAMNELLAAFESIGRDPGVRAVILRGLGPAFSAGHDLREVGEAASERDLVYLQAIFDACVRLMAVIQTIPQPVIAEVAGIATAAGCQLVASCDLALASNAATFATPGVKIGLFCTTPMVALTRAIGRKRAMMMLLTGEPIDAHTAERWGLINRVVAPDDLATETRALAAKLAAASGATVGLGKAAFYRQIELDQNAAYAYAKDVMARSALEPDAGEGIAAFLARRAPAWTT